MLKKGKTETRVLFIIGALAFSLFTLSACTVTSETESAPTAADTVSNSAEDQFIGTVTGYGVQTQGWGGDNENTVPTRGTTKDHYFNPNSNCVSCSGYLLT